MSNAHAPLALELPRLAALAPTRIALIFLAAAILSIDPVLWLVNTWRDPAYDSNGLAIAVLIIAALTWSRLSPLRSNALPPTTWALPLIALSAVLRAAGQLSAINILAALTLIVDVYALAVLLRLDQRTRPLSPGWIAVAFAFCLPLERMLQRSIGYGLQQISADGACGILGGLYDNVRCEGIRILLDGRDVLVDLPCSGARTLLALLLAMVFAAALSRPRPLAAAIGIFVVLAAAAGANILRITALAIGIAFPETLDGIDVMSAPWHDAIGYIALGTGSLPLLVWMRWNGGGMSALPVASRQEAPTGGITAPHRTVSWSHIERLSGSAGAVLALFAVVASVMIVNLPRRAIDVAKPDTALRAPAWIMGQPAHDIPLSPHEARYFTAFGGGAVKASYGASSLMLVRTTSPLRHLHAPDECLRGLGFDVSYRGTSFSPLPTAHYLARAPDGSAYRIDVSFTSNFGHVTGSVAIAVWHWLKREAPQWTAIQRISPVDLPLAEHQAFSSAALFSLGIEPTPKLVPSLQPDFLPAGTITIAPTPAPAPISSISTKG